MAPHEHSTLDTSGLACPIPLLKTRKAIDEMQSGQVLKLIATDPGSVRDVTAWAARTGHVLLGHSVEKDRFVFFIAKG